MMNSQAQFQINKGMASEDQCFRMVQSVCRSESYRKPMELFEEYAPPHNLLALVWIIFANQVLLLCVQPNCGLCFVLQPNGVI